MAFSGTISTSITPASNGSGSALLLLDCKGATVSATVNLNSRSNLKISGGTNSSSFGGTAFNASTCTNVTVDGWTTNYADPSGWPIFIVLGKCTNFTVSNCTVNNCGYGFLGDGNGITLRGVVIVIRITARPS